MKERNDKVPNQAAPVNAPIAFWFQFGHSWWRVTEQRRSATCVDVKFAVMLMGIYESRHHSCS
jgi:hypothetical protein